MQRTLIQDLKNHIGQEVTIAGWMYNKRGSGKLYFLQLRDGSGTTQGVVVVADVDPATAEAAEKLTQESSLTVTGKVNQHPKNPDIFELQVSKIAIIQLAGNDYPISKKEHGIDFLLDNRHLWLRSDRQWAIQRIRDTIVRATVDYFHQNNFIRFDSPILTPNACEGTSELFDIEYFELGKAYLSQSGQLYLEAAIMSLGKAYDFGPVFRAEKSKTRRHLTEFWMMDAEAAFADYEENMNTQEELVHAILTAVLTERQAELKILERNVEALEKANQPFLRKTHADVVKELQSMGSDIKENDDLGGDDETILTKKYDQLIFVEKYPAEVKAFYMKRDPQDESRVLCSDLLAPEGYGEIIGGSQREDDYDKLLARIREHKLPEDAFKWYLELRKYGSVPHSGFGYGLERLVTWICGLDHVRESIPFARTPYRLTP
jgi:asparaginyl-tRNA synthetase